MSNENAITALHSAAPASPVPPVPPVLSVLSVPVVPSPTTPSRRRNRPHPPNCVISDLAPSRFLAFRAKQSAVEAEYGFRLGVPRRTDAERDGYRRYMRDWRRRYGEAHREVRKAYRHAYWLNVTKRGFDSLAEANGDEAALKRKAEKKAAKQKRADYEARKRQVHEQYGFWLNTPPRTPEEAAGRDRYRKDQDVLRKERNRERILAYQKAHNAKRREENERKFQDALKQLAATDPVAAEKFKARHETLCRIQHMTPDERIRYREQKEAERRKAQAARTEARKQAREEARRIREARKAEERRLQKPKAAKPPRPTKRELWLREMAERRKEREAQAAERIAFENEMRKSYAAEREANRKAYLERKNASSQPPASASESSHTAVSVAGGSQFTATANCVATESATRDHGNRACAATAGAVPIAGNPRVGSAAPAREASPQSACGEPHNPDTEGPCGPHGNAPSGLHGKSGGETSSIGHAGRVTLPIDGDGFYAVGANVPARPHSPQGLPPPPPKDPPRTTTGGTPPEDDDSSSSPIPHPPSPDFEIARREREFVRNQQKRVRKVAAKKRKATIARKRREAAAQAAREAQAAEREARRKEREEARQAAREAKQAAHAAAKAARAERKALLKQGLATFGYKVRAFENKKRKMRKALGLPAMKRNFTPEQRKAWNDYLRESRRELQGWLIERMRQEQAKAQKRANADAHKASVAEAREERERREKEREERKRLIFEKYGFTLGKAPVTPEEIEGFKRWKRDQEAAYRERNREHLTAYNRDYRRRKRVEALAKEQTTWTPAQWRAWKRREADKACPPGSPSWLVREVVKQLAAEQSLPADAVMARLIELGGLDFLIKGAESMGRIRCARPSSVAAAVRALALYLDPDAAAMFGGVRKG